MPESKSKGPAQKAPAGKGENRVDKNTVVQTEDQRGGTPIEGVDPFPEGWVPDEGLHGNVDY